MSAMHGTKCRRLRLLMGIFLVAAIASCSSGHTSTPREADKPTEPWDPCTGITDNVLFRAGLDPATKVQDAAGAHYPGWDVCKWRPLGFNVSEPTAYSVTVMSTNTETVDHIRRDPLNNNFVNVTVGRRPTLQYHLGGDDSSLDCALALRTASNGVVLIITHRSPGLTYPEPVCDVDKHAAENLLPTLPQ